MPDYTFNIQRIDQYGYHPFISFYRDGKKMNALIDTGASCNFLNADFFEVQGDSFDGQQATGFGNDFPVESRLFEQINFSGHLMIDIMMSKTGLSVINEPLVAMGLKKVDGILGSDYFEYLRASVDFSQNKLFLGDDPSGIPFWYDEDILQPTVVVYFNGHPATMIIDTGASQTILDSVVAESMFPETPAWEKNESPSIGITPSDILESRDSGFVSFENPASSWSADFIALRMQNINKAYEILGVPPIDAIIGADFLIRYGARIDYWNKELIFPDKIENL